jgi:hypothetical protein
MAAPVSAHPTEPVTPWSSILSTLPQIGLGSPLVNTQSRDPVSLVLPHICRSP